MGEDANDDFKPCNACGCSVCVCVCVCVSLFYQHGYSVEEQNNIYKKIICVMPIFVV